MSKQTITEKSQQIRNETQKYANTRGRVADVLDDINETKADKEELETAISEINNSISEKASVSSVEEVSQSLTKEVQDRQTADNAKLEKTTQTITEPNAEFKYAYITNEANETRRMLAGDLGKNIANTNLTSIAGAGLTLGAIFRINTEGFPFIIQGLDNKKSDPTHNLKLKANNEGELSVSDEPDVKFTFPETSTITINTLAPSNSTPQSIEFGEELRNFFQRTNDIPFTEFTKEDFDLWTMDNIGLEKQKFNSNIFQLNTETLFEKYETNMAVLKLESIKDLPSDKDWQIKINLYNYTTQQNTGTYIGIGGQYYDGISVGVSESYWEWSIVDGSGTFSKNSIIYITKIGEVIFINGINTGLTHHSKVFAVDKNFGNLKLKIIMMKGKYLNAKLSHKLLTT